jgi:DNA-(apurinic or apyrimidinic site) lyase
LKYDFPEEFSFEGLLIFFQEFLPNSTWNKRLLNMKIPRLWKTEKLFEKIVWNEENLYNDLFQFQITLSKCMKQQKDTKTILFALKMFHYAARIKFGYFLESPYEIWIPLDSRLAKISKIYNTRNLKDQDFWMEIARRAKIPCLHLDAILWTRCNDFICF